MAINRRKCLIILAASIILLALPGCSGESPPASEGQVVSDAPTESQVLPTATRTEVPPAAEPAEPPAPEPGDQLIWDASDAFADTGLLLDVGGDVDTEPVQAGPSQDQAHRTGNSEALPSDDGNDIPDNFLQFRIDDEFVHGGSPTARVRIEVEYLDAGTDRFFMQYDGENDLGPFGDGRFSETDYVRKTDTGEFLMAVFWVNDGYFANRDNGSDFRIDDASDGAETIRRVTVTRIMPGSELASALFVNYYDDGNQLRNGQCTTLHWQVQNATEVTLNGDPVDPQGYDYECPETTTMYTLTAWNDSEERQEEITISVSGPNFDLQSSCWFVSQCSFPYDCFRYAVSSSVNSLGISNPVTFDGYMGSPGAWEQVFWGYPVDPLSPGQSSSDVGAALRGSTLYSQCCRIILLDSNDRNPSNDSYEYCR